jgi:hypothetical protein
LLRATAGEQQKLKIIYKNQQYNFQQRRVLRATSRSLMTTPRTGCPALPDAEIPHLLLQIGLLDQGSRLLVSLPDEPSVLVGEAPNERGIAGRDRYGQ